MIENKKKKKKKKKKKNLHPCKELLSVWWDMFGVIHFETLPPNQTITVQSCSDQLDRLHEMHKEKRSSLVNHKGAIFLQDNARPLSARITCNKIEKLGRKKLPHPLYCPDIAPSDYHLFQNLQHFFFSKHGINKLVECWENVVHSDGHHIID